MFVASHKNTTANARFQEVEPDGSVRHVRIDVRARMAAQEARRKANAIAEQTKAEARQRLIANEAIDKANRALRNLHAKWAEEDVAEIRRLESAFIEQVRQYRPTYAQIERRACRLFKCTRDEIVSSRRHRDIVFVRQFIAYWASRRIGLSLPKIGKLMGGRDHTTILHHKRKYPEKRAAMGRTLRQVR